MRQRRGAPRADAPSAVLIDSSAFFALVDQNERHHSDARAILDSLAEAGTRLFTTNFILAEAHALILNRSRRHDRATAFLRNLYNSESIVIIRISEQDETRALAIIESYRDKRFSFTDATSFAVMERLGISHVFTFDADFRQYGWPVLAPGR